MNSIRDIIARNHRLSGRAEGYRNAADSIDAILGEQLGLDELIDALETLRDEMREQAEEDTP